MARSNLRPRAPNTKKPKARPVVKKTPPPSLAEEIHIILDTGTEYTKGAFRIQFKDRDTETIALHELEVVTWPGNETFVRTQLAVVKVPGARPPGYQLLWGEEVNEALQESRIREEDAKRYFKRDLFQYPDEKSRDLTTKLYYTEEISDTKQVCRVKTHIRFSESLTKDGIPPNANNIEEISLYAHYMRLAFRYILKFIAETHSTLGWEIQDIETKEDWTPPGNPTIRVGLPLPVASTPQQTSLIMIAAEAAGMPNPYPMAEPASALAYHLLLSPNECLLGKTFLIIDIGAGSVDLKAWTVINIGPLKVREAHQGATRWCGGSYVNEVAKTHIMNKMLNNDFVEDLVFESLAENKTHMSKNELGRQVEREFEKQKRKFDGTQTTTLKIPGLPIIPTFGMVGGGRFQLLPEDMEMIFEPSMVKIMEMINTVLERITTETSACSSDQQVDEILLVGGGSQSPYLRSRLRDRYDSSSASGRYRIPVSRPSAAAIGSTTVSKGALLLLADKVLVHERIIRRGYCIGVHDEPKGRHYPQESLYTSPHDGRQRVNQAKFLICPGQALPQEARVYYRGERVLLEDDTDDNGGWTVEECLYYSDTVSDNGVWVEAPDIDIHEMPSSLWFTISEADAGQFVSLHESAMSGGRRFYKIEYEVGLVLKGDKMTFEFVVPRRGTFPPGGDYGPNPIRQRGSYDCIGAFHLFHSDWAA